jgi:hypothetical protein
VRDTKSAEAAGDKKVEFISKLWKESLRWIDLLLKMREMDQMKQNRTR